MLWENSSVVVAAVAAAVAHPGFGGGGGGVGELEGAKPPQDSQGGFGGGEARPNTLPGFGVRPGFGARPGFGFSRNQITKMRLKRMFVI